MPSITNTQSLSSNALAMAQSIVNVTGFNPLQQRLQSPASLSSVSSGSSLGESSLVSSRDNTDKVANRIDTVASLPQISSVATSALSNFLPSHNTPDYRKTSVSHPTYTTYSPPNIESLVANSAEDVSSFRDVTFDIFDDDDDLFGSPLAFDASENGLWNGRFVPPPPRPPFFVDDPVFTDGITTCDLCSWAMPTKSTFTFESTIEKATELGWPLALVIVSLISAVFGAIIMVTVVRCRRKKASNNRNETHVQWWSRYKRPNSNNNNHLRRSNIYTAHPADSIRGLQQPTLSASSSLTAITAMGSTNTATTPATISSLQHSRTEEFLHGPYPHHPHYTTLQPHLHSRSHYHLSHSLQYDHHSLPQDYEYEHEYHQPEELQLHVQHCRENSSSVSSVTSSPSLITTNSNSMLPLPMQFQHQPQQHNTNQHKNQHLYHQPIQPPSQITSHTISHLHHQEQQKQRNQQIQQQQRDSTCHWPNATMIVAS